MTHSPSVHSPSPWRYLRDRTLSDYDHPGTKWGAASIESENGCVRAIAHVTHDKLYPDETDANILLIEAAPELLDACVRALSSLEHNTTSSVLPETKSLLRSVNAKATTRQAH